MATVQPTWVAVNYRFAADDGAIGSATWLQAENTAHTIANGSVFRLRVRVGETANATTNNVGTWTLQASINGGTFATVAASSAVQYYNSANLTNGDTGFTGVLSDIAAALDYQSTWNEVVEDGVSASRTWTDDECELEFCCKLNTTAEGDTVTFRMLSPQATAITFTNVPTLRIAINRTPTAGVLRFEEQTPTINRTWSAAPTVGALRFDGQQPTLAISDNYFVTPTTGAVVIVGQQPTLTIPVLVTPTAGTLRLVGQTPTLTRVNSWAFREPESANAWFERFDKSPAGVAPSVGTLRTVGQQPTITVSEDAGNTVSPTAGTLILAGQQPTLAQTWSVAPTAGLLRLVGQDPTLAQTWSVSPTTGTIIVAGQTPTVAQTWSVLPTVGTVRIAGQTPTLAQTFSASPATGTVQITGQQPSVAQTWSVGPQTGEFRFVGQQPVVLAGDAQAVLPTTGVLRIDGQHPTVALAGDQVVSPQAGELRFGGYAPVLAVTEGWYVTPVAGTLRLVGQPPTVQGGEAIVSEARPTGGWLARNQAAIDRAERIRREIEEERERQELADRLEAELRREGVLADAEAERLRLQALAAQYNDSDLPNRVARALRYAQRARTDLAVELALREFRRMQEEEEMAVLLALVMD